MKIEVIIKWDDEEESDLDEMDAGQLREHLA